MGSDKAAEKTPASQIILELNPDKDLIDLSVDDEKLLAVFFYPEDKEISIVGSSIREAQARIEHLWQIGHHKRHLPVIPQDTWWRQSR